jgi:glycosyltransferase involved in cell wall biosynthesis
MTDAFNHHAETWRPLVSAVLAVRNEERHIAAVLRSLLEQETTNFELEIIVVDGASSDATPRIVLRIAGADRRVKLEINKRKKTPYAFNLGIQASRGEYVCILGAHTAYARNYIAACLEELKAHGAVGCSGRVFTRPGADGVQAQLIAWALGHAFGTSSGSMRIRGAGFADTIPYPVFLKSVLLEIGGYDTSLHRNQDNDLNQRLRARGYKLYITDKTSCEYFVSSSAGSLAKYAFKTGAWNVISFKRNRASMSLRHFVPGAFVIALSLSLAAFLFSLDKVGATRNWLRGPLLLLAVVYGIASIAAACQVAFRERSLQALFLPVIFLLLHVAYGAGTLSALLIDARPPTPELNQGCEIVEPS